MLGLIGIDDPMQHQGVQRKQRSALHNIAISLRISIRDPFLSPASFACKAMVLARTPDRIRIAQPERGRLGSSRQVDKELTVLLPQTLDQMNRGREVAVKDASRKHLAGIARTIELELIHSIAGNKIQACFFELRIVLRARQSIAVLHYLVVLAPAECNALLLLVGVATPRRKPYANPEAVP